MSSTQAHRRGSPTHRVIAMGLPHTGASLWYVQHTWASLWYVQHTWVSPWVSYIQGHRRGVSYTQGHRHGLSLRMPPCIEDFRESQRQRLTYTVHKKVTSTFIGHVLNLRVGIEPMINGTMSICSVYSCPATEVGMIHILVSSHRAWLIRASVATT